MSEWLSGFFTAIVAIAVGEIAFQWSKYNVEMKAAQKYNDDHNDGRPG